MTRQKWRGVRAQLLKSAAENLFIFVGEKFLPRHTDDTADRVANFVGKIFRQIAESQLRILVRNADDVTSRVIVKAIVRSHSRVDRTIRITLERTS